MSVFEPCCLAVWEPSYGDAEKTGEMSRRRPASCCYSLAACSCIVLWCFGALNRLVGWKLSQFPAPRQATARGTTLEFWEEGSWVKQLL